MSDLINRISDWLWELTKVLSLVVSVALLVSVLFGPGTPFFGGVLDNIKPIIDTLGSEGLGVVIALIIILGYWNNRS
ncbi:MAG: hypothetical protein P8J93_04930 [SAR86 cluster bacterium]|jgi:hypothetical protein|nr:hypothetical protein [SAR86 cluster bacterium]|tara:strand:- start:3562 stop:3792 length:231 start_codon:yes stop_codon:yes gene_type:complete